MTVLSFAPSAALKVYQYFDVDEFRQSVRTLQVEFVPLFRQIAARQTILNLPGCDINLIRSFPRLMDAQLAPNCSVVGFTMDDDVPIRFNGVDRDRSVFVVGHGGGCYTALEKVARQFTSIIFTPEIHDRGWPRTSQNLTMFEITEFTHQRLRELVLQILKFASEAASAAEVLESSMGIKESLLVAIDAAFSDAVPASRIRSGNSARYFKIVHDVEAILSGRFGSPVYSAELARQIGVSVRTLHTAVLMYRGMSLHRYLRLKRLWLVRQQLVAGNQSVKACALACGFWHFSDFSRAYRLHFGEAPSQTLAKAQQSRPPARR
jgi:AraC-like DNA-binding protein